MPYKYVEHQKLLLKTHPEFNEKWVQERIAEEPTILGIGELILKDQERNPPGPRSSAPASAPNGPEIPF